jgi:hypothetical protein
LNKKKVHHYLTQYHIIPGSAEAELPPPEADIHGAGEYPEQVETIVPHQLTVPSSNVNTPHPPPAVELRQGIL